MPPLEAVAVDPGAVVTALGHLTVSERRQLASELRARGLPLGAPHAGQGGASASDSNTAAWVAAGVGCLVLSGLASMTFWRRRKSS